ncbi:MAG: hypothetical protein VB996_00795 [Pseudomonadales bacterium]|nr:hypothetical protein [Pseudomonadales bacterium]
MILSTETFPLLGLINGLGQLLLFAGVVCLPVWRTGRMCYVDIGWPWGLVLLLGAGLLFTSRVMYSTLVYGTGAIPSEHYSLKKRPGYKESLAILMS